MLRPGFFTGDVFDDFFDFPFFDDKQEKRQTANYLMKTDIKELEKGYELEIDLPGYKKEEIQAELKEGYLTIRAVKAAEQKKEEGKFIRRERYSGSCQRSFFVGKDVTQEDIKAEFKDGILRLQVPKKEAKPEVEENKYISIE